MGVTLGLLVATVTSLNVTTSIVLQLGDSISGVAGSLGGGLDVAKVTESSGGFGLPALDDNAVVEENIRIFKIVISMLILIKVIVLSAISTRLRGGGASSAMGTTVQMLWVAALTSLFTAVLLDSSMSFFTT